MGESADIGFSTSLLLAGIVGMLLLACAVIFFVIVYQSRLFAQRERMQQQELDYQRRLVDAAIETQEAERKRIAGDLHDEIGSMLSAMRLYLQQIDPDGNSTRNQNLKEESLQILTDAITSTRRITHNLLPPSLEQFGLIAAVEDMVHKLDDSGAIDVSLDYNVEQRFDLASEVALYRVINELLNNTLKHAAAKHIAISVQFAGRSMSLKYKDDGKGFVLAKDTQDDSRRGYGLGMKSIDSRVNFVGGEMTIDTRPGEGFEVVIHIPALRPVATDSATLPDPYLAEAKK